MNRDGRWRAAASTSHPLELLTFMKVEYFGDGSFDCPLILLYGSDPNDAATLSEALGDLAHSAVNRVAIHELPGFSSIDGCQLFGSVTRSDLGLKMVASPAIFDCLLRPETWDDMIGLLEPFSRATETTGARFQYLNQTGDVRLLISTERTW
jgi:hypothetical protein